jgi:hypothetical protein
LSGGAACGEAEGIGFVGVGFGVIFPVNGIEFATGIDRGV